MGTRGDHCPMAVPPPGAGRGDSRLMPNLERRPHLLSTMSMTERKREAKTAKATATETWDRRNGGDGARVLLQSQGQHPSPSSSSRGGRKSTGETEAQRRAGGCLHPIPSHLTLPPVCLHFKDCFAFPQVSLCPLPQITEHPIPAEPSPQMCAHPLSPRGPPESCSWCLCGERAQGECGVGAHPHSCTITASLSGG